MLSEAQQERYTLQEKLGRGAMGEVWLATDTLLGRQVAIKFLHAAHKAKHRDLFLSEARMLASLAHPNITTIYDAVFEQDAERIYLVMEYIEGQPLEALIAEEAPLPLDTILDVTMGILRALQYAHQKGVVHRDIKPANVIIQPNGVKLTDFGMAALMSRLAEGARQVFGTPSYIAPEQADGRPVDGRADLYSLGVLLFEMVTGHLPFTYDNILLLLQAHLRETPPSVRTYIADVPLMLEQAINRLLTKKAEDRYPSAEVLMNVLNSVHARQKFSQPHLPLLDPEEKPLIGRAVELKQLQQAWRSVQQMGAPGLIVLQGEMGVGKTRLIAEFLSNSVVDRGLPAFVGRCDEFGVPYTPFAEILTTIFYLELAPLDSIADQVELVLNQMPDLKQVLGKYQDMLTETLFFDDPQLAQWQFFEAIQTILRQIGPCVFLLENATLLDEASVALTRFLVRRGRAPVLLLAPCRDDGQAAPWLSAFGVEDVQSIALTRLPEDAVADYLVNLLDGPASSNLIKMINSRARGNPFFIEEIVKHLIDLGDCYQADEDGVWTYRSRQSSGQSLPSSLLNVLNQRLARLTKKSQKLLAVAAVIGQEFDFDLWLTLLGGEGEISQALDALDEAFRLQILRETGDNSYIFSPIDMANVLVENLSSPVRRYLHRQVAELLLKQTGKEATIISHHYLQAGLGEAAARYLEKAGARAKATNSLDAAITYYRQANEIVEAQTRYEVLGDLYRRRGIPDQSVEVLNQALEMAQETGDATGQARILNALAFVFWMYDHYQDAEEAAAEILRLPNVSEIERAKAQSHLGMVSWLTGNFREAEYWCERAVAALKRFDDEASLGAAYNLLGLVYFSRSRYTEAKTIFNRSLEIRQRLGDYWGQAYSLNNLGKVATDEGAFELADSYLRSAQQLFEQIDSKYGLLVVFTNQARVLLSRSQVSKAMQPLEKALQLVDQIGQARTYGLRDVYLLKAKAILNRGEVDEAQALTDEALKLVEVAGSQEFMARGQSILAHIYTLKGELALAEAAYQKALAHFEKVGSPAGLLQTKLRYARFLTIQGQTEAGVRLTEAVQAEAAKIGLYLS